MENKKEEIWKDVIGFEGIYQASSLGRIKRNSKLGRMRKLSVANRGYVLIGLNKHGKYYMKSVHRIIAKAFIPNPENKKEVKPAKKLCKESASAN